MTITKEISKVILEYQDKYLLYLRDNKPQISFPNYRDLFGGGIDEGESPLECAVRELQEELTIVVEKDDLKEIDSFEQDQIKCYMYSYALESSQIDNLVLGEGQQMQRYTKKEIEHLHFVPWYKRYFV